MKVFEISPKGETLTASKRDQLRDTMLNHLSDVTFDGGTTYCNPLHLASELERNDSYILFIEPDRPYDDRLKLIDVTTELINWLRGHRHETSYGAIEAYITDGPR